MVLLFQRKAQLLNYDVGIADSRKIMIAGVINAHVAANFV